MSKYAYSEEYEAACQQMVGKKYHNLLVLEYVGMCRFSDGKKERALKCRCDCGEIVILKATRVRNGDNRSCPKCRLEKHRKSDCPCWDCAKATNKYLCPWAGGGVPRDDWDAEPCMIDRQETYKIKSCPEFVKG